MFQLAKIYSDARDLGVDYYFQNEKWFKNHAYEIKTLFGANIPQCPYVSVHVRRGDYLKLSHFHTPMWEGDYYDRAIEMFPGREFLVFSDDIPYCKERFKGPRFHFSEGKDEITDMNLMAGCEDHIMANSSFSWWGAYISPWPNQTIVAPKETSWFRDGVIRTKLPANWTQI
jgi:hypothetical protein